jgi:hypothetical protein
MRGCSKVSLKECVLLILITTFLLPTASAQSGDTVAGGGAVLTPTGAGYESNTCFECHSDSSKVDDTTAADEWVDSVHYENDIGCERCHSASVPTGRLAAYDSFGGSYRDDHVDLILDADKAYKAPSAFEIEGEPTEYSLVVRVGLAKQQAVAMCARCHGLTPITPDEPKNVFQDFITSVHGQSVVVGGLGDPEREGKAELDFESTGNLESAVCTDCHNPHATKSKDDPNSQTHKDNVPALCGTEDCHGSDDVADKYEIINALATYKETHHGKAQALGAEGAPNCIDCHVGTEGAHRILSSDDPTSSVHPDNVAKSCADDDCHGVEFNVGSGSMHGKDKDSTLGKLIDLFYKIVIPVVVIFFALYVVLDFTLLIGKKGGE